MRTDNLLRYTRPAGTLPPTLGQRLTDAQVLTTALVAARFFGGNLVVAKHYREQHWGQNHLDKSGFTHRLHALTDTLMALFATVGELLKHLHTEARYVLDSFPVAVCHNTRIPRCKLLTGKAYHGRCASKRNWFYSLKVQSSPPAAVCPSSFISMPGPSRSRPAGAAWCWICPKAACSTPTPIIQTTWPKAYSTRPEGASS